ncbi:hypothetical protein C8R44DRAFT_733473 [Mycena epipterygia]|nr:hypothetical protein C8R44DRAFT_733473 [Mycena epipterygia]
MARDRTQDYTRTRPLKKRERESGYRLLLPCSLFKKFGPNTDHWLPSAVEFCASIARARQNSIRRAGGRAEGRGMPMVMVMFNERQGAFTFLHVVNDDPISLVEGGAPGAGTGTFVSFRTPRRLVSLTIEGKVEIDPWVDIIVGLAVATAGGIKLGLIPVHRAMNISEISMDVDKMSKQQNWWQIQPLWVHRFPLPAHHLPVLGDFTAPHNRSVAKDKKRKRKRKQDYEHDTSGGAILNFTGTEQ